VIREKQLKLQRPPKAVQAARDSPKLADLQSSTSRSRFQESFSGEEELRAKKKTGSNWISLDIGASKATLLISHSKDKAHRSYDEREPLEATKPRVFGRRDFQFKVLPEESQATRIKLRENRSIFPPIDKPAREASPRSVDCSELRAQPRAAASSRRGFSGRSEAPHRDPESAGLGPLLRNPRTHEQQSGQAPRNSPRPEPNCSRSVERKPGLDQRLAEQLDRAERLREEGRRFRETLRGKHEQVVGQLGLPASRPPAEQPRASLRAGEAQDFSSLIRELHSQLRALDPKPRLPPEQQARLPLDRRLDELACQKKRSELQKLRARYSFLEE
jgi:hypothetical protein